MTIAGIFRVGLVALASGVLTGAAFAQQDVQITSEAISRTCAEVHHAPNVEAEAPTIRGAQDITLNCRLIGAGGATIAQLSPAEVCQRLTGSNEWYRGMGTQVFCRPTGGATAPAPRSFTINEDDIAKACQRTHRNPQATAAPTTVGPYGLELNCRLTNQDGVTLARVSPEDVCDAKFGTREWMGVAGSKTFVCKGTPVAEAPSEQLPNKPPAGGGGAPKTLKDVPLTSETVAQGCRALHGAGATAAGPLIFSDWEPVIKCNTGDGLATHRAAQFCPQVSATSGWYMRALGPHGAVCRGSGPREYDALANVTLYCRSKGHRWGNQGVAAQRAPACFDAPGAAITITIADVCRGLYGTSASVFRDVVYWCLR